MTNSTTNTAATTTITALRGLGRFAYRMGKLAHQSVTHATTVLGRELDGTERRHVLAGWNAERSEA